MGMELLKNIAFYSEMLSGKASREYEFEGDYGPLVAIHGVFGGWSEGSLKTYMENSNVKGTLLYFGSLLAGVDSYLPKIQEKIIKYKNPLIVGLSTGGILAIKWVAENNYWEKIDKIVTVGSPLGGLPKSLGRLGKFAETARELQPESTLLKETSNIKPPENKMLSIFAKDDFYTPSPRNLKLGWPTVVLETKSHSDLILNQEKWLRQILDAELGVDSRR